MLTVGKKVVMGAMIALQMAGALAAPVATDFESPKASFTKVQTENEELDHSVKDKIEGEIYFQNLNGTGEFSMSDILDNEIAGVYKNPTQEGEIMVISFQNSGHLKSSHNDIKKDLIEQDLYEYASYETHRAKELTKKYTETGSFHSLNGQENIDYNFISFSTQEAEILVAEAKKLGYSEKLQKILPSAILLHEMAHTHNHQSEPYYDEDTLMEKSTSVSKMEEHLNLLALGGENYADADMFLQMGKILKLKSPETAKQDIQELAEYFMNDFRDDSKVKSQFDTHASKATIKTAIDFVEDNWEILEQFTDKDMEQISASITNGTLNNPMINKKINSFEAQKELAENGGIQDEIVSKVSKKVNDKLKDMITVEIDSEGKGVVVFEYKANAHDKYNERQSNKYGRG